MSSRTTQLRKHAEGQADAAADPVGTFAALFITALSLYVAYGLTFQWPFTLLNHILRPLLARLKYTDPRQIDLSSLLPRSGLGAYLVPVFRFLVAAMMARLGIKNLDRAYVYIKDRHGSA